MSELTKEQLKQKLLTDDKALIAALVALNGCQTEEELASGRTIDRNGMGFRAFDSKVGSGMVKFYKKTGFLTPKQIEYWKKKDVRGKERIICYLNQLHTLHLRKRQEIESSKRETQQVVELHKHVEQEERSGLNSKYPLGSRLRNGF
jgi:hypothetical protein